MFYGIFIKFLLIKLYKKNNKYKYRIFLNFYKININYLWNLYKIYINKYRYRVL